MQAKQGEMPERSNGLAWNAGVPLRVPRVRIPLSPPSKNSLAARLGWFLIRETGSNRVRASRIASVIEKSKITKLPNDAEA